jgi:sugar transferase (PEP-CTERM system associated)
VLRFLGGLHIPRSRLVLLAMDTALIVLGLMITSVIASLISGSMLPAMWQSLSVARCLLVLGVWEVALYYNELYEFSSGTRRAETLIRLAQASGMACLMLAVVYYVHPQLGLGRAVTAMAAPSIMVLLLGWRLLIDHTGFLLSGSDRVLIVGTGEEGICLVREILKRPDFNLKVVGFLDERGENIGKRLVNPGIIGAASEVQEIVARERIDRVILSFAERRGCTPLRQLLRLKFAGVPVEDAHGFYEKLTGRILLERLSPSSLILSEGFRKSRFLLIAKRAADLGISLVALVITSPLMGAIALAIWIETGGPVLFRQRRVGLWGREFEMVKFRSMHHDAEANGPCWAVAGDKRVTRVGRFLRHYRLDELPQFLNVLCGEMSLVGPRPERPHFCAVLEQQLPLFSERHCVRPGITGWAQIKYQYGSTAEEAKEKLQLDLFYIKHLSGLLDLAILLETFKVVLLGRGAK